MAFTPLSLLENFSGSAPSTNANAGATNQRSAIRGGGIRFVQNEKADDGFDASDLAIFAAVAGVSVLLTLVISRKL